MVDKSTDATGAPVAWCCVLSGDFHAPLEAFLRSLHEHTDAPACTVFVIGPTPPAPPSVRALARFVDLTPTLPPGFVPGAPGAPSWASIAMASKPVALAYMLDEGHRHVVYADADLWLVAPPASVLSAVRSASIVLTPHVVLPPASPRGLMNDLLVLTAGTFNAGLVGVSRDEAGRGFCAWWAERTLTFADRPITRPSDQRWLNLVPYLFRGVMALDDPGVNVGHWRIESDDDVERTSDGYALRGHPLSVLHMSGFDPERPSQLSRHAPDLTVREHSPLGELARRYAACLRPDNGGSTT